MFKISIIIPTINEAKNLPLLLSDLSIIKKEGEILIIDSNSNDRTTEIASIHGAKVYKAKERNRGLQLDIGAKKSIGEWLIFLHADTRLNDDWVGKIKSVLEGNKNLKNSINYFYVIYFKFKKVNKFFVSL